MFAAVSESAPPQQEAGRGLLFPCRLQLQCNDCTSRSSRPQASGQDPAALPVWTDGKMKQIITTSGAKIIYT